MVSINISIKILAHRIGCQFKIIPNMKSIVLTSALIATVQSTIPFAPETIGLCPPDVKLDSPFVLNYYQDDVGTYDTRRYALYQCVALDTGGVEQANLIQDCENFGYYEDTMGTYHCTHSSGP
jgi:hypothetical protein